MFNIKNKKEWLQEYLIKYQDNESIELNSITLSSNILIVIGIVTVVGIFIIGTILSILNDGLEASKDMIVFYAIFSILLVFVSVIAFSIVKKSKSVPIQKVVLKDNQLLFYEKNKELKIYNLNETDLKYKITSFGSKYGRAYYYHIYVNDNNGSEYQVYMNGALESFLAFVLFANLVKNQKINKIDNLSYEDIEILQNEVMYKK